MQKWGIPCQCITVNVMSTTHPLAINLDLCKAEEKFYESLMASWCLGWHVTFLSKKLYSNSCQGLVLEAVIITVSCKSPATPQLVVLQCPLWHNVIWLSMDHLWDCRDHRSSLLATLFIGFILFGGQFPSSVEVVMHSCVIRSSWAKSRHLVWTGSRSASGPSAPEGGQQYLKRCPPPLSVSSCFVASRVEGGSRVMVKTGLSLTGLPWTWLSLRLSRVPRGGWFSSQRPPPNCDWAFVPHHLLSHPLCRWDCLSWLARRSLGSTAWYGLLGFSVCFSCQLAADNLRQICLGGG